MSNNIYKYEICSKEFKFSQSLNAHKRSHIGHKSINFSIRCCSILTRQEISVANLAYHEEAYLKNLKDCPQCGKKHTKPKFCSQSCAATYNNLHSSSDRKRGPSPKPKKPGLTPKSKKSGPTPKLSCRVKYSPITGEVYNNRLKPIPKDSWAYPSRFKTAKRLSEIFSFKIPSPDALKSIEKAIQQLYFDYFDEGLSGEKIREKYKIQHTNFGMFLKKCLDFKLRSVKDSTNNYFRKIGRNITDKKKLYRKECRFNFDPYNLIVIPGYELLLEKGIYHPINNPEGMCRDHVISVEYGWREQIHPELISHPANCQFLTNKENIDKGESYGMSIKQLQERIKEWEKDNIEPLSISYKKLPKTKEHKRKISETNSRYMNVTNGIENRRILKTNPIPEGFRRGQTRRKNLVPEVGFEPT